MAVGFSNTNKPINPRGQDQSPLAYNRAKLYSGKALDFDGVNDYVDLAGLTFSGNNQSFAFYLKADAWNNFDYIFDIFSNRFIIGSNPGNNLSIYDGTSWQSFSEIDDTINTNFFVVTIEGTTSKAYLNGVQFGSNLTISLRDFSAANECALMSQYDGAQQFFPGKMSGFKAFDVALTAAQVADLYNNPEKVVPTGVDNTALKLWLPMMEGAGTTAYDGSGNGNHGTISGATYVNGVGAPVAQSAVMDWNKGSNLTPNSEDFGLWILNFVSVITNDTTAPDGQSTADKIIVDSNNNFHRIYRQSYSNTTTNDLAFSVYLKYNNHQHVSFGLTDDSKYRAQIVVDLIGGVVTDEHTDSANVVSSSLTDVGNGWYKLEGVITPTTAWGNNIYTMLMFQNSSTFSGGAFTSSGTSVYAWGAQAEFSSNNGPYVLTFNSSQDSAVLLPQGLTTGRDITGVNLFENVRKQGALNLDGNSWAEVHDNGSLDFGTGGFTLEVWAKLAYENTGSSYNGVLGLGNSLSQGATAYIYTRSAGPRLFINGTSFDIATPLDEGNWHHLVVTRTDAGAIQTYYDGAEGEDSGTEASTMTNALTKFIGRDANTTRYYKDQIAQPRIYNRALTAEEVLRNYNSGKNTYK